MKTTFDRIISYRQTNNANKPMHLTTMPSALLSQILRPQDLRQKQVVAGDRGRSAIKLFASLHGRCQTA